MNVLIISGIGVLLLALVVLNVLQLVFIKKQSTACKNGQEAIESFQSKAKSTNVAVDFQIAALIDFLKSQNVLQGIKEPQNYSELQKWHEKGYLSKQEYLEIEAKYEMKDKE